MGHDGIAYRNIVEDPGTLSVTNLRSEQVRILRRLELPVVPPRDAQAIRPNSLPRRTEGRIEGNAF